MSAAKLIDDADTLRVTKVGNWTQNSKDDPNAYNTTLSYTLTVGDSMKVKFNGTFIAVFGTFDSSSEGVITNYSIDGTTPVQVTMPPAAGDCLRQQFWAKKLLAPGPHTLDITMVNLNVAANAGSEGTIWFDFFQVDNSNVDIKTAVQWNVSYVQPSPNPSHIDNTIPVGAIVGIVIGSLFFLLGAAYLLLMWQRMRQEPVKTLLPEKRKFPGSQTSVEPFLLSHQYIPDHTTSSSQMAAAAASSAERLEFDANMFVRGPPALNNHKSMIVVPVTQDHDPGLSPGRPRSESIGGSSSNASTSHNALPPGAKPPTVPPISIPMTVIHRRSSTRPTTASTRPTTAQSATTATSHISNQPAGADGALDIAVVPPSPGGSTVIAEGEGITVSTPPPRQHVDSGVREPGVILAHSSRQKQVDLPPVYSPI